MGMKWARINQLEQYILSREVAGLDELCEVFQVSKNTLRRDLAVLTGRGNVVKVYGGVRASQDSGLEPIPVRSAQCMEEKRRIGQLAASLVEDGDTLFIDSGTTSMQMIPFIAEKKRLTIITHSLEVMNEASRYEGINLISLGGIFSAPTHSFVGASTLESLQMFEIRKAFMATTAVSVEAGMMNTTMFEAEIKRGVIARSGSIYLMVDASKFDTRALLKVCPLERVDCLITDRRPPEPYLSLFAGLGHRVLYE